MHFSLLLDQFCLSVCPLQKRDRPMVTTGSIQSHHPSPTSSPNWRLISSQPLVKTRIRNCGQMVTDTMVVCTYSLWEHTISMRNSTNVNHRGGRVVKKINRYLTALYTRPVGTYWLTAPMPIPIGASFPPNLGNMPSISHTVGFLYLLDYFDFFFFIFLSMQCYA